MSGKDKINIFPSRGAQTTMKGRLKAAQKGHSLLKKKADALQLRFRMILKKIVETKQTMGEVMKEAAFSLAEAKFARGEFNQVCWNTVLKHYGVWYPQVATLNSTIFIFFSFSLFYKMLIKLS